MAKELNLKPVSWQPQLWHFRLLALSRSHDEVFEERLDKIIKAFHAAFLRCVSFIEHRFAINA